jgi:hypothetical protein
MVNRFYETFKGPCHLSRTQVMEYIENAVMSLMQFHSKYNEEYHPDDSRREYLNNTRQFFPILASSAWGHPHRVLPKPKTGATCVEFAKQLLDIVHLICLQRYPQLRQDRNYMSIIQTSAPCARQTMEQPQVVMQSELSSAPPPSHPTSVPPLQTHPHYSAATKRRAPAPWSHHRNQLPHKRARPLLQSTFDACTW